jgi:MoaA/NifB/PqqE/SkfB family radical SAM enzyme
MVAIVSRFQAMGVTQLHFSGGEPLRRLDDILSTVKQARPGTEFWLFTSGVGMDRECAHKLERAGVTGVNISIDHWRPDLHDAFRGFSGAFEGARRAAGAVNDAGLALCLTLCPTREFISHENLRRYADLATELGAGFIQILEPRRVGRFAESDVTLSPEHRRMLEEFFMEMNSEVSNSHKPMVVYPASDQRRLGCLGAGWRYIYVDTDAQIHPCPFCRRPVGSALDAELERHILALRRRGCTMRDVDGVCPRVVDRTLNPSLLTRGWPG